MSNKLSNLRDKFDLGTPVFVVALLSGLFLFDQVVPNDLYVFFGCKPGSLKDIWTVITAPFFHGSYRHLVNNLALIFPLLIILFKFFKNHADSIFLNLMLWPYVIVWFVADPTPVVGASTLAYGLLTFLISIGFLIGRGRLFYMSLFLAIYFGNGLFNWGVMNPRISWEAHGAGSLVGVLVALLYSKFIWKK